MADTLARMRDVSQALKSGEMTIPKLCGTITELKVGTLIPRDWIQFLDGWISRLDSQAFWTEMSVVPDYRSLKYSRRFFPTGTQGVTEEQRKDWKELTQKVLKGEYPDMDDKKIRHSNHKKNGKDMGDITNFGVAPPREAGKPVDLDMKELQLVTDALIETEQADMLAKLVYLISINYDTCHMPYENKLVIKLVDKLLNSPKWRSIILTGLWYGSVIMAHEEELAREGYVNIDESHRFVFTLNKLRDVTWLRELNVELEHNPLISVLRVSPIASAMVFHLNGKRAMATTEEIEQRINTLTCGALRGIERFENVALVGSTLTECVGELPLGDWKARSDLYYAGGDIDIAVSESKSKTFVDQVGEMMDIMSKNLGSRVIYKTVPGASGVRFHVSHPRLHRHFEIFRTNWSHLKLVAGFHVPCVKAYWNFRDLVMTRSFLTSMLTGVCESFDWFSSNKIPLDIILKNAQRGYSVVLNGKELVCIGEYLGKQEGVWAYPQFATRRTMTGEFIADHPFFRVDVIPKGVRAGMPIIGGQKMSDAPINVRNTYTVPIELTFGGKPIIRTREGTGGHLHINPPPVWS